MVPAEGRWWWARNVRRASPDATVMFGNFTLHCAQRGCWCIRHVWATEHLVSNVCHPYVAPVGVRGAVSCLNHQV